MNGNGLIYYGDIICQNKTRACKNKAYYILDGNYLCGVHSRKGDRLQLPKRTKQDQNKIKMELINNRNEIIAKHSQDNVKNGKKGSVVMTKMYMMKEPEYIEGYLSVFPNYKHQNRVDGYGCMKLSPKYLGPVKHGQPNLPDSLNLENFHQFSKCFKEEVDEKNNPTELYYENRLRGYLDPKPHRHKYKGNDKNKNIPLYFIWVDNNNKEHRLNYIESRQFYCNFYERLASVEADYIKLKNMIDNGYNLNITGYDANKIDDSVNLVESIEKEYLDPKKPFGHEKVLYTMLLLNPIYYPWRKYKTFDF